MIAVTRRHLGERGVAFGRAGDRNQPIVEPLLPIGRDYWIISDRRAAKPRGACPAGSSITLAEISNGASEENHSAADTATNGFLIILRTSEKAIGRPVRR